MGDPKGVAEGVPTAVRPDQHQADIRYRPVGWLRIVAPPSWSAQVRAHCWCACGFERDAIGRPAVQLLITAHTEHRGICPLLTTEGRNAA